MGKRVVARCRTGSQQASARAELNSATASPSRSLANGVSQRYAKYVASPSSQPSLSELEHGPGQHLMASPRADKLSLHSRRPPSLPHSPARPRPPALPASPSSSPQSLQPLTGQGERVTAHKRSHLTPQLGQSRLQSPLAAAAAQQPATSSREEPRQSFELPAGSPSRPAGGWNPLQSSSAVNSLIDWTHNVSSLQVELLANFSACVNFDMHASKETGSADVAFAAPCRSLCPDAQDSADCWKGVLSTQSQAYAAMSRDGEPVTIGE